MPQYYVNIRVGDQCIRDHDGVYEADLNSALAAVVLATTECLSEGILDEDTNSEDRFEITDENGQVRATVPMTANFALGAIELRRSAGRRHKTH